ncbi:ELWxxDGT repeat protein [Lacipirellula sp.]|uniref:ELWxxDGT repeat protein n=1 Tax=Lacipirellula sp. TaxID=2691419 RepID=UPI003D0CC888
MDFFGRPGEKVRRLGFETLEERRVLAADFELLVNATTHTSSLGSQPTELTRVGDVGFFVAWTETTGAELWKTDGTEAGTEIVKDIRGGRNGSAPGQLTNVNGVLYFTANDGVNGAELWKSDGTAAGTERLSTTAIGPSLGPVVSEIVAVGNSVFFTARTTSTQTELWKTDGTAAGTILLRSFFATLISTRVQQLTEMNGALYFFANDGAKGMELWRSDGTTAGTAIVKDIVPGSGGAIPVISSWIDADLVNAGGTLYFSATSPTSPGRYDLWKSDGTAAGTVMVKSGPASVPGFAPQHFFAFNGEAYFVANDGTSGLELWKSNGTTAGTTLVKDLFVGSSNGMATDGSKAADPQFTVHNGQLYFTAVSSNSRALWRTDGTAAGTTGVSVLPLVSFQLENLQLQSAQGKLYLVGGTGDEDLYVSDGLTTTWQKLAQLDSARTSSSNPQYAATPKKSFLEIGSRVLFSGATGQTGAELWSTDGSIAGTSIFKDISNSGLPTFIDRAEFAGSLYFAAGGKLWKSDGTPAGTVDVTTLLFGSGASISGLKVLGDRLYLFAWTDETGRQFWTTDGTQAGTWRMTDIRPADGDYSLSDLTLVGETLYFSAHDEDDFFHIWQSDGTLAGTSRVTGYSPKADKRPSNVVAFGNKLLFAGEDDSGINPWVVQGGVAQKLDAFTNSIGGQPQSFVEVAGQLFFTADDGSINRELWKTDGTTAGTMLVKDINLTGSTNPSNLINLGGVLYFTANDGEYGSALWRSDGTAEGTYRVAGLRQSSAGFSALSMVEVNGILYFTADDGVNGVEIWRSNGTNVGTYRVTDLAPGTASGFPTLLTNVYGTLYFSAYDEVHGEELWKSDGTPAGTVLAKDFVPGAGSSAIRWIGGHLGGVFASATTPDYGHEVWAKMPDSRGDYNNDGVTDGADFLAWQRAYGAAATPAGSGADGNGDGTVNGGDLGVWKTGYGTGGSTAVAASDDAIALSELTVASLMAGEEISAPAVSEGADDVLFDSAADAAFAWLAADRREKDADDRNDSVTDAKLRGWATRLSQAPSTSAAQLAMTGQLNLVDRAGELQSSFPQKQRRIGNDQSTIASELEAKLATFGLAGRHG